MGWSLVCFWVINIDQPNSLIMEIHSICVWHKRAITKRITLFAEICHRHYQITSM